jgi:hypothetical protein
MLNPYVLQSVGSGYVHEIANASATQPAKFLLIHRPSRSFDFVKSEPEVSV